MRSTVTTIASRIVMRRFSTALAILAICLCAASCGTWKDFCYLQDAEDVENMDVKYTSEVRVRKGDALYIYVCSRNPESAQPFNLVPSVTSNMSGKFITYQVDEFGDIEFPQLGIIHCEGMTRTELAGLVKGRLISGEYLKDPIVTVEFVGLTVSVLGEVTRPGSYAMNNAHTTLFEALSMAGDLTEYGRRDRVAVIREVDGKRTILYHDLRSKDIFDSPRYYLQQNDVVYVEPNKAKAMQSNSNRWNQPGLWLSCVSTMMSLVTFLSVIL